MTELTEERLAVLERWCENAQADALMVLTADTLRALVASARELNELKAALETVKHFRGDILEKMFDRGETPVAGILGANPMTRFRVGDRVKVRDDDRIGVIVGVSPEGTRVALEYSPTGGYWHYDIERLELAASESSALTTGTLKQ